jgi:hypothetical protein
MEERPSAHWFSLIAGAALGALAMYVLDPQSGRRRVALARDRARHLVHEASDAAGTSWRDLRNRVFGIAAGVRQRLHGETPSDRTLEERVRAELGRWVTHPHAVRVRAHHGAVVLSGSVLAAERAQLQRAVEGVNGVRSVELRLAVVDTPDGMPSTLGGGVRSGPRPPWPIGERHAPATRLLGVGASAGLLASGLAKRGMPGLLLSVVAMAIAADLARTARGSRLGADIHRVRGSDSARAVANEAAGSRL